MEDNRAQIFELPPESELRVECKLNRWFYVSVVPGSGACEIFGSEIGSSLSATQQQQQQQQQQQHIEKADASTPPPTTTLTSKKRLGGGKWAFFTYKGCSIELETISASKSKKTNATTTTTPGGEGDGDDDDSDDEGEQSGEENDEGTKNDEQQAIEIAYISEETPMVSYLNVHGVLEAKRK